MKALLYNIVGNNDARRGRIVVRIDMVKVGKEEGGFVCSELSKKSSGLSW